eukprot:CAMPEP_0202689888 /NCGR_PEP_ID=MMETSP1385-20130828/5062_1 /ASSEMBLY_ACC=CAM_ASM_000861 /TAXON_ID=933848 /ORGANISM="Elphidium margaritaceum" /LENGTH=171 /DNA_ID=CAMNT_0049345099 /DNA_START=103 /DNA_END=618 /DNA_ORIENTATION=-
MSSNQVQRVRNRQRLGRAIWDPFVDTLHLEMDRHLSDLDSIVTRYLGDTDTQPRLPSCSTDIQERNDAYEVHVDMPGVKKEDIDLNITDKVLSISGERKYERETKSDEAADFQYYHQERFQGKFSRVVTLPDNIDEDLTKVSASYNDGVLNIVIPKQKVNTKQQSHKINIT